MTLPYPMRAGFFRRCAVFSLLALTARLGVADDSKISPDLKLAMASSTGTINVICQYVDTDSYWDAIGKTTTVVGSTYSLLTAVSATMSPADITTLSNQQSVNYLSLDRNVRPTLDYSTAAVNAPIAWQSGLNGTGVGIAVIDSGIYPHQDLAVPYST